MLPICLLLSSLHTFAHDQVRGHHPQVHFFSEGPSATFAAFARAVPGAIMHLSGLWQEAIDTLSRCNVLIGGKSSFFALGAHLCDECKVIAPPQRKFAIHAEELIAAAHHELVPLCDCLGGWAQLRWWQVRFWIEGKGLVNLF